MKLMKMKLMIIVIITGLLMLTACSNNLTGDVIGSDACKSLKNAAKDDCYFESGQCSKIKKESVRNSCVAELGIKKQDLTVCNLITSDGAQGYCQSEIALQQNNVKTCLEITDKYWKDNCHFAYAIKNNQGVFCAVITAPEQQQDCFYDVATASNDSEFCSSLPDIRADQCVFKIAQNTKDIKLCDSVVNPTSRDACRLKLASRILMDESLCNTIKFNDIREVCRERFTNELPEV